jgi:hypothetical protein
MKYSTDISLNGDISNVFYVAPIHDLLTNISAYRIGKTY